MDLNLKVNLKINIPDVLKKKSSDRRPKRLKKNLIYDKLQVKDFSKIPFKQFERNENDRIEQKPATDETKADENKEAEDILQQKFEEALQDVAYIQISTIQSEQNNENLTGIQASQDSSIIEQKVEKDNLLSVNTVQTSSTYSEQIDKGINKMVDKEVIKAATVKVDEKKEEKKQQKDEKASQNVLLSVNTAQTSPSKSNQTDKLTSNIVGEEVIDNIAKSTVTSTSISHVAQAAQIIDETLTGIQASASQDSSIIDQKAKEDNLSSVNTVQTSSTNSEQTDKEINKIVNTDEVVEMPVVSVETAINILREATACLKSSCLMTTTQYKEIDQQLDQQIDKLIGTISVDPVIQQPKTGTQNTTVAQAAQVIDEKLTGIQATTSQDSSIIDQKAKEDNLSSVNTIQTSLSQSNQTDKLTSNIVGEEVIDNIAKSTVTSTSISHMAQAAQIIDETLTGIQASASQDSSIINQKAKKDNLSSVNTVQTSLSSRNISQQRASQKFDSVPISSTHSKQKDGLLIGRKSLDSAVKQQNTSIQNNENTTNKLRSITIENEVIRDTNTNEDNKNVVVASPALDATGQCLNPNNEQSVNILPSLSENQNDAVLNPPHNDNLNVTDHATGAQNTSELIRLRNEREDLALKQENSNKNLTSQQQPHQAVIVSPSQAKNRNKTANVNPDSKINKETEGLTGQELQDYLDWESSGTSNEALNDLVDNSVYAQKSASNSKEPRFEISIGVPLKITQLLLKKDFFLRRLKEYIATNANIKILENTKIDEENNIVTFYSDVEITAEHKVETHFSDFMNNNSYFCQYLAEHYTDEVIEYLQLDNNNEIEEVPENVVLYRLIESFYYGGLNDSEPIKETIQFQSVYKLALACCDRRFYQEIKFFDRCFCLESDNIRELKINFRAKPVEYACFKMVLKLINLHNNVAKGCKIILDENFHYAFDFFFSPNPAEFRNSIIGGLTSRTIQINFQDVDKKIEIDGPIEEIDGILIAMHQKLCSLTGKFTFSFKKDYMRDIALGTQLLTEFQKALANKYHEFLYRRLEAFDETTNSEMINIVSSYVKSAPDVPDIPNPFDIEVTKNFPLDLNLLLFLEKDEYWVSATRNETNDGTVYRYFDANEYMVLKSKAHHCILLCEYIKLIKHKLYSESKDFKFEKIKFLTLKKNLAAFEDLVKRFNPKTNIHLSNAFQVAISVYVEDLFFNSHDQIGQYFNVTLNEVTKMEPCVIVYRIDQSFYKTPINEIEEVEDPMHFEVLRIEHENVKLLLKPNMYQKLENLLQTEFNYCFVSMQLIENNIQIVFHADREIKKGSSFLQRIERGGWDIETTEDKFSFEFEIFLEKNLCVYTIDCEIEEFPEDFYKEIVAFHLKKSLDISENVAVFYEDFKFVVTCDVDNREEFNRYLAYFSEKISLTVPLKEIIETNRAQNKNIFWFFVEPNLVKQLKNFFIKSDNALDCRFEFRDDIIKITGPRLQATFFVSFFDYLFENIYEVKINKKYLTVDIFIQGLLRDMFVFRRIDNANDVSLFIFTSASKRVEIESDLKVCFIIYQANDKLNIKYLAERADYYKDICRPFVLHRVDDNLFGVESYRMNLLLIEKFIKNVSVYYVRRIHPDQKEFSARYYRDNVAKMNLTFLVLENYYLYFIGPNPDSIVECDNFKKVAKAAGVDFDMF